MSAFRIAPTRRLATRPLPATVMRASPDECPPLEAGLDRAAVDRLIAAGSALYGTGVYPGVQLCMIRRGSVVLDRAWGHARGNGPDDPLTAPKVPYTPTTPTCIFSASKAITAMLIHHLDDRGMLHIDDRVAEYIPEFARHGKEGVTLRHVLTHRAGLPGVSAEQGLDMLRDPASIVALLCDMRLSTAPGRRLAYHAVTGGFLLGEIVRRVTGQGIEVLLEDVVRRPLGMEGMRYGWPADRLDEVAQSAFTGRPVNPVIDLVARKALGVGFAEAAGVSNTPEWLTSVVPSGNIIATAREIARFFELLRNDGELDGVRVFSSRTVRRAVVETAFLELDLTMMLPIRYGNGLMLGAWPFGIFGPDTPAAFGHLGFTNIFAWADPQRALSVALLTTGKPLISDHVLQLGNLLRVISSTCRKVA
jgi:CubicO group peptidase (beta-lactamase class C family)